MRRIPGRLAESLGAMFRGMPVWARVGAGGALALLSLAGVLYAARTYDAVQHDIEFCLSCHLMVDPFERFGESAHRDLPCTACHQASLPARTGTALTQVVEWRAGLAPGRRMPNDRCAACHAGGDPELWRIVAATAGHRIHFESREPELAGLLCTDCHSSGLHDFHASGWSCATAGCHAGLDVRFGAMHLPLHPGVVPGGDEIYCTLCHNYLVQPEPATTLMGVRSVLTPGQQECAQCHEMEGLMTATGEGVDPHGTVCGNCHNPHVQVTARDAVDSCTNSGCHGEALMEPPMHRGLTARVLVGHCLDCHMAHEWQVDGERCLLCHDYVLGQEPGLPAVSGARIASWLSGQVSLRTGDLLMRPFNHVSHAEIPCERCHDTADTHGRLLVQTRRDCSYCHHVELPPDRCSACHPSAELQRRQARGEMLRLSVWTDARVRVLPFDHEVHDVVPCVDCHVGRPEMTTPTCATCHEQHHIPERNCMACHTPTPIAQHDRLAHLDCTAAGCHEVMPVPALREATRNMCLVCHQDQVLHEPGQDCRICHLW